MERKKNPVYDLNTQRPLFLSIGFTVSVLITLSAFEWKTEIEPIVRTENFRCTFPRSEEFLPTTRRPFPPATIWKETTVFTNDGFYASDVKGEDVDDAVHTIGGSIQPATYDLGYQRIVEEMPYFKGGMKNFHEFLRENIVYPHSVDKPRPEGRVFVKFIVEKDGSLSNMKVVRGVDEALNREALRVMKLVPNFNPGKRDGTSVRTQMVVPIHFQLE
ncbi:MAG: energy transducer TonB [Bacteroidota bacterium]